MNLAGVGVSIVDHVPREIARVTLGGLHFAQRLLEREQVHELTIASAQVDNQLLTTTQPVVLIKAQVSTAASPPLEPCTSVFPTRTTMGSVMWAARLFPPQEPIWDL